MFGASKAAREAARIAEIDRMEWTADKMLLDADELFANELGIFRPEPHPAPDPRWTQMLGLLANQASDQRQQYQAAIGQLYGPRPPQAMGATGVLGLGGIGNALGLGRF